MDKVFLIIISCILSACSTPVREFSQQELENSFNNYSTEYQAELANIESKSGLRLKQEYLQSKQQSYDILVLSGGGPLGAFGAGFLKGWGNVAQPEYLRPHFDTVSGVSTGALIAPFAFIGTEQAYNEIVELYRNPDEELISAHTLLALIRGNESYYDATVLHNHIKSSITPETVSAIAKGGEDNRVLLVGATNLDYGLMRVWDLSEITNSSAFEKNHEFITSRLIASAAIPGVFPSVNINNYLYVDGGASMQVVSGIDDRQWLYGSAADEVPFATPERPIKIRIWVIINNKLVLKPDLTERSWSSILTRSIVSLMSASTLQTLQDMETYSQMINKLPQFDVQMNYVSIPQEFEIPETKNMFDKDKMRQLVELGITMGAEPKSWQQKVLRPGAPLIYNNTN